MTAPVQRDLDDYLARPTPIRRYLDALLWGIGAPVIVDIGACEGEDTIRYARAFPRARIFAFEPLPENQAILAANLERYAVRTAELVPCALSDVAGDATLYVSSGTPAVLFCGAAWNYGNKSNSLLAPASPEPMHGWISFDRTITVAASTLDRFCVTRGVDRIHFMHLDVQGAEYRVLAGAATMLPKTDAVWVEVADRALYRGQRVREDVERFMRGCGFRRVFEFSYGVERDQLYVNTAVLRPRWLARAVHGIRRLGDVRRRVRAAYGRLASVRRSACR